MDYLNRMNVAVLIALAAISCVKEKEVDVPRPEQIQVTATLADQLETRVTFTPGEDENGKPGHHQAGMVVKILLREGSDNQHGYQRDQNHPYRACSAPRSPEKPVNQGENQIENHGRG